MTAILGRALEMHHSGFCALPVHPDKSKRPAFDWKPYQQRRPTIEDVEEWAARCPSLGVVCGAISGNLEMLEFEGRAVDDGVMRAFLDACDHAGLDWVYRITEGWSETSPSGGRHWYYRVDGPVAGNTKLARQPNPDTAGVVDVLIETRGEGGWVVVAPTPGDYHPTGVGWTSLHGGPATVATITAGQRDQLHQLARTFDRMPEQAVNAAPAPNVHDDGLTPGDDYNCRATWPAILEPHGWQHLFDRGDVGYWRRPGKTDGGISATTNALGTDRLRVFTTSTVFDDTSYSKHGAYAVLEHGGDLSAAARALRADGYGAERAADISGPWGTGVTTATATEPTVTAPTADGETPKRRLKLTPASSIGMKVAKWVWDGRIPRGALTLIGGREGIGKSTYAYDLAADLTRGKVPGVFYGNPRPVLVAATEDSWEHTINPRLAAAGANRDMVYRIDVHTDDLGYAVLVLPSDLDDLAEAISEIGAALVLLDPLLSRLDGRLDTHKDADVRRALEPITRLANDTDCAVVGLIHVNKGATNDALTSLMGSRAFSAVARAVIYIMVDPDDRQHRLLGVAKNNLGRTDLPTLRFTIENTCAGLSDDGEEVWVGKIVWSPEPSEHTIDEALAIAARPGPDPDQLDEAAEWLADYMASRQGSAPSKDVLADGRKAKLSAATLKRARSKLAIRSVRLKGYQAGTAWLSPGVVTADEVADHSAQHSARTSEPEPNGLNGLTWGNDPQSVHSDQVQVSPRARELNGLTADDLI